MERVFYDLMGFLIGTCSFMLLYWIAGIDVPSERSPELLMYIIFALAFGAGGVIGMDSLISKIKWWLKHD